MYEQINEADLVIADLSTSNLNAAFELGVRYALRRRSTIVVAEEGFKAPFNIGHINILRYTHNGDDVPRKAAMEFQEKLIKTINQIMAGSDTDSPVYAALPRLSEPSGGRKSSNTQDAGKPIDDVIEQAVDLQNAEAPDLQDVVRLAQKDSDIKPLAVSYLDDRIPFLRERQVRAESAMRTCDYEAAALEWKQLLEHNPNDSHVIRQFILATAMAKTPTPEAAVSKAKQILLDRGLLTSTTDPDTFALWGFLCKRSWDLRNDPNDLSESILAYQRTFSIRQDYREGIMLFVLLEVRSSLQSDSDEKIADRILAKRIRAEVIQTELSRLSSSAKNRLRVFNALLSAAFKLANPKPAGKSGATPVDDSNPSYQTWFMALSEELCTLLKAAS